MSNPFSLEIKLKQHTPIIHFQHDQAGATLRATEVKARLDRFITQTLKEAYPQLFKEFSSVIDKCFYKTKNGFSGDYKLKIISSQHKEFIPASYVKRDDANTIWRITDAELLDKSPFFANSNGIKTGLGVGAEGIAPFLNGDFSSIRKALLSERISLVFSFFRTDLKGLLNKLLPIFLSTNNFGTRQTKSFGCYTDSRTDRKKFEELISGNQLIKAIYKKELPNNFLQKKLEILQADYQLLKGGKSFGKYEKSLLWRYLCGSSRGGISWEKKMIKEKIKEEYPKVWNAIKYNSKKAKTLRIAQCQDGKKGNYYFIRALLGLAEYIEFIPWNSQNSIKVSITDLSGKMERFPSPITFKIFQSKLYLIAYQPVCFSNDEYSFEFELDARIDGKYYTGKLGDSIQVPGDFDISDFLTYALSQNSPIDGYQRIK